MSGAATLEALATTPRLLIALDFDGTLSPLSDEPMSVRMVPEARAPLAAMAALPDTWVALVSGRSLHDLRIIAEHSDDSPVLLAGSHGVEYWTGSLPGPQRRADEVAVALRDALQARAEAIVAPLPGVWVEPKAVGFAVHTRLADEAATAAAQQQVGALLAREAPDWRRRLGHDILEYSYRDEGKDTAVRVLRDLTGASAVLFAGDDVTDEDALASLGASDLGVLVGDRDTHANLRVGDIAAMAALLARLAELRATAVDES